MLGLIWIQSVIPERFFGKSHCSLIREILAGPNAFNFYFQTEINTLVGPDLDPVFNTHRFYWNDVINDAFVVRTPRRQDFSPQGPYVFGDWLKISLHTISSLHMYAGMMEENLKSKLYKYFWLGFKEVHWTIKISKTCHHQLKNCRKMLPYFSPLTYKSVSRYLFLQN